jgi:hypothetical protein
MLAVESVSPKYLSLAGTPSARRQLFLTLMMFAPPALTAPSAASGPSSEGVVDRLKL